MMKNYCLLLLVLFVAGTACQQENKRRNVELPGGTQVTFLNQAQAQQAIVQDRVEHYFDKVSPTDIEIQSKTVLPDSATRTRYLAEYKSFLQDDVKDFTTEDKDFLSNLLREIGRVLNKIDPSLLDQDINLIKVGGRHYGPSVFYTRENNIIIPAYELAKREGEIMRSILIHEIFHIYSRYHPEKRDALYAMIGFHPLGISPDQLEMPASLRETILLNPDGIDYTYAIDLRDGAGNNYRCIPLTSSDFHQYSAAASGNFPHLTVNFYPVVPNEKGGFTLQTTDIGTSPLNLQLISESLWAQIGKNTRYIIHPDEILADNFSILAAEYLESEAIKMTVEEEERDLLHEMEQIIQDE